MTLQCAAIIVLVGAATATFAVAVVPADGTDSTTVVTVVTSHGSGRLTGRAEVGFDSYEERYAIADTDTLSAVNEWRSRLRLGWTTGALLRDFALIEGRLLAGQGNYEAAMHFKGALSQGSNPRNRVAIDLDVASRGFDESSSFQFPNDYKRYLGSAWVQWALSRTVAMRLTDRVEHVDFEQRTQFDYDYLRNSLTASADVEMGLTTYLTAAVRLNTMSIPDSNEIEYHSLVPYIEFRSAPELRRQIYVQTALERRIYDAPQATRSSFSAWLAILSLEWGLGERTSIQLDDNFELYDYDTANDAYFEYFENRLVGLFNYYPKFFLRLGAGGAVGWLSSSQSAMDEYREVGVLLRADYNQGAKLWFSLEYEPGQRTYPAFNPDGVDFESIFSNYTYHRLSLYGSWRIWNGLAFNLMVDYQPEDHERKGDDATATLFSLSLSYVF